MLCPLQGWCFPQAIIRCLTHTYVSPSSPLRRVYCSNKKLILIQRPTTLLSSGISHTRALRTSAGLVGSINSLLRLYKGSIHKFRGYNVCLISSFFQRAAVGDSGWMTLNMALMPQHHPRHFPRKSACWKCRAVRKNKKNKNKKAPQHHSRRTPRTSACWKRQAHLSTARTRPRFTPPFTTTLLPLD